MRGALSGISTRFADGQNARLRRTVANKPSPIHQSIDRSIAGSLILLRSEIGCRETSIDASSGRILQRESPSNVERTCIANERIRIPSYVHVFSCKSRFVRRPRKRLSGAVARLLPEDAAVTIPSALRKPSRLNQPRQTIDDDSTTPE